MRRRTDGGMTVGVKRRNVEQVEAQKLHLLLFNKWSSCRSSACWKRTGGRSYDNVSGDDGVFGAWN